MSDTWRHLLAGIFATILIVLVVALLADLDFEGARFGNLAEWTAAIGTVLAFAVTYRLLRHEVGVRKADEERRARIQAEGVRWEAVTMNPETGVFDLEVVNGPHGYITDVAIVALRSAGGPREVIDSQSSWQMAPDERCIAVFNTGRPLPPDDDGNAVRRPPVEVSFTDSNGQRWCISANGRLDRVSA